jgi:hypothetical protein
MRRVPVAGLVAGLFALVGGAIATPAAAQTGCSDESIATRAVVDIEAPAANSVVSGTVNVRGSASTTLVVNSLARVEITFAGVTKSQTYSPSSTVNFNIPFDTSGFSPGTKTIDVVACGALAYGEATRSVTVPQRAAATTVVTGSGTTAATAPPGSTSAPQTTVVGQAAAGTGTPTTVAGAAGGSTTTAASTPSTTEATPDPVVVPPQPTTTRVDPRANAPLVLTEAPDDDGSGTPLWVGAVVGISGGLGLLFSAVSWRRRANVPEPVEPVDPELVEVG